MAKVTITLEDIDLDAGTFSTDLSVDGSRVEDGQVTAAHMTAFFIMNQFHNPAFVKAVWDFAAELIANNPEAAIANNDNAPDNVVPVDFEAAAAARAN